uniref:Family with sequence similarity 110 member A n=1 Tax=Periophthalmus magnuspinnatus TaxID=409849 RepID=A0A3B3ZMJ9_9GOBI
FLPPSPLSLSLTSPSLRLTGAPFRILHKGPDYFRRQTSNPTRKLSAVERLEADKAKYVKSQQVALNRQAPIIRKPLMPFPLCSAPGWENAQSARPSLDLDILNNLINVCDGATACSSTSSSPSSSSPSSGTVLTSLSSCPITAQPPPLPSCPPPVPARLARVPTPLCSLTTAPVAVRRVDVRPQAEGRPTQRRLLHPILPPRLRQTAQGQAPSLAPPSPATQTTPPSLSRVPTFPPPSPLFCRAGIVPPASPAFTRLSSASSRGSAHKRPALHRSKSDLSDRFSRASADLERFFNYCGLDPGELQRLCPDELEAGGLCSVSTPSSECEEDREDSEGEEPKRVPYGISVIERNARVIKWLYGIRQAKENIRPNTNMS